MTDLWNLVEKSASHEEPLSVSEVADHLAVETSPVIFQRQVDEIVSKCSSMLSLDLSVHQTGVFAIDSGRHVSDSLPPIPIDNKNPHHEAQLRRDMSQAILDFINSNNLTHSFEYVAVEDAFVGRSNKVSRTLYAINSSIDELILDNKISCEHFHRVNNVSWKAVWSQWVGRSLVTHLPAKERVQAFLSYSPYNDEQSCLDYIRSLNSETKDLQDRYDAFSVGVSILLPHETKNSLPRWSEVHIVTSLDMNSLMDKLPDGYGTVSYEKSSLSKNTIRTSLSEVPGNVFISSQPRVIGSLLPDLADPLTPRYFAFWV